MGVHWFPKNECLETYANQFNLVIQDLPKDTNILIHGSGIRYNYCCFGAWTMLAASNAFIILHDHDFITTKSQEAVLLIKPMLFQWFHKITFRNVWTSTSSGSLNWSKRLMIIIVFLHSSCSKSNAQRRPSNKSINISLDVWTNARIMLLWLQCREQGDPRLAATARLFSESCCGCREEKNHCRILRRSAPRP